MALPIREQAKYWGIACAVFVFVLWAMGDVLLPFLVGGAIAYFLDPLADRLERRGMSRTAATAVISLGAALLLILLFLSIIPTLISQLGSLIAAAPQYVDRLWQLVIEQFPELEDSTSTMRQTITSLGEAMRSQGPELANSVLSSVLSMVSAVVFIVIVPVVAFYLLLDWDKMLRRLDALIPPQHAPVVRRLARESDAVLSGFVRGQVTICLIQALYYSISLMAVGLQFGLVVGAIAGTITFIPYIGSIVGGVLAIGLALFQFWGDWVHIGLVVAIFSIGQFVEGNILTPKLMGKSVGLHPVWLLLALSAFGSLLGFTGMLVAVPMAAVLGVLARFAIEQYQASPLYTGAQAKLGTKVTSSVLSPSLVPLTYDPADTVTPQSPLPDTSEDQGPKAPLATDPRGPRA